MHQLVRDISVVSVATYIVSHDHTLYCIIMIAHAQCDILLLNILYTCAGLIAGSGPIRVSTDDTTSHPAGFLA